jgi:hypothetical protein
MTIPQGINSPLDYSLFSRAACALLLLALQVDTTAPSREAGR